MVCGGLRWFVVVCGGLWWIAVVCLLVIPPSSRLPRGLNAGGPRLENECPTTDWTTARARRLSD